ncbi:hypothetical protein SKAU_G00270770 [Synaphobranchus kaupii]|uniref:Uncharacterized protein n=1 Tax=Synaphobranchus kaupii TaxID=118154 RepID=A0A9Q1F0B0_SYNKA|nr:hypothetical protein SKAU_G00270770 [Synaphobranchus kaupii]
MDVVQFVGSLLDLHRQQLQALARQGEIQAAVLAQLLEGEGPGGGALRMPRLRLEEGNLEAYLSVFEQAAASCRLPRVEWGARLAGLIGQEAQEEVCPTSTSSTLPEYDALKARILSRVRAEEDQSRLDFLSVRYDPLAGVGELGRRLDRAAKRWLRPERRTAVQVEQQVAMEQFVSLLPEEAGSWVHRRHPRDMDEAIRLAEQCLSRPSEESSSPTSATPTRQTDASDGQTEPGDSGTAKQHRNCDQAGLKENITESFLNKLDTVKLESVHFSLDIPELEVIYLDDEGLEENLALKQEVSEPGFPTASEAPQIAPDREHGPQGAPICTQDPLQQEGADRRCRLRTKTQSSLTAVERMVLNSERHDGTVPPLRQPRRHCSIALPPLAPPAPPVPAPTPCEALSVNPQLAPPLPCSSALARYQDAMANVRLKDREDFRWRPFLSKLGLKRKPPHGALESGLAPSWSQDALPRPHKPRPPAERAYAHCCPDCGRSFTQVSSLQEHRNIHTGEKPFRCQQCGKAFHHRRTLNKHSRVHSGERPFPLRAVRLDLQAQGRAQETPADPQQGQTQQRLAWPIRRAFAACLTSTSLPSSCTARPHENGGVAVGLRYIRKPE